MSSIKQKPAQEFGSPIVKTPKFVDIREALVWACAHDKKTRKTKK